MPSGCVSRHSFHSSISVMPRSDRSFSTFAQSTSGHSDARRVRYAAYAGASAWQGKLWITSTGATSSGLSPPSRAKNVGKSERQEVMPSPGGWRRPGTPAASRASVALISPRNGRPSSWPMRIPKSAKRGGGNAFTAAWRHASPRDYAPGAAASLPRPGGKSASPVRRRGGSRAASALPGYLGSWVPSASCRISKASWQSSRFKDRLHVCWITKKQL